MNSQTRTQRDRCPGFLIYLADHGLEDLEHTVKLGKVNVNQGMSTIVLVTYSFLLHIDDQSPGIEITYTEKVHIFCAIEFLRHLECMSTLWRRRDNCFYVICKQGLKQG